MLAVIPADRLDVARAAVEHYHAYVTPLRMARMPAAICPACCAYGSSIAATRPSRPSRHRIPTPAGAARRARALRDRRRRSHCVVVENTATLTLYVSLFDCAASGRVLLLGTKGVPKRSKHVFRSNDQLGEPFPVFLAGDRDLGVDRIVAIATTRSDVPLDYFDRTRSFDDLIKPKRRSRSAEIGKNKGAIEPAEAWTSAVTALRVVRA